MSARKQPMSRAALAKRLRKLACEMFEVAVQMEYGAGFDVKQAHDALSLVHASGVARQWADDMAAKR